MCKTIIFVESADERGRYGIDTILTIAGFDPSSGAGVTADLAVIAAHGCFGTAAITALTVQSTLGVRRTQAVEAGILAETLECVAADLPPLGIKLGMLANEENVKAVAKFIARLRQGGSRIPVVLDPVMRSSSGRELLNVEGVAALQRELLPLVDWITPNLQELCVLVEMDANAEQMEAGAGVLGREFEGLNIVATGGDLKSADDLVRLANGRSEWMRGAKIDSRATHGTGCAFSTALVCGLAAGLDALEAASRAKRFVREAILRAVPAGNGTGPMNLLWPLRRD